MELFLNKGQTVSVCLPQKIVKIMRITTLLCLLTTFCTFASVGYSQTTDITLDLENVTLKSAFDAINVKTDYSFWYRNEEVNLNKIVSIKVDKQNIDQVLHKLLDGENLLYSINEKHIIIYRKNISTSLSQGEKKISGRISDSKGEPIAGANIVEKGTQNGTMTNADGSFSLEVGDNATLQISYIGYMPQEILIKKQNNIFVKLEEDTQCLEEVVVVGYGTVKKSDLTGAVSQIDPTKNKSKLTSNVTDLLKNSIPGLNIPMSTNAKGSVDMANISIRGQNSIKASNTPLIILDGMVYSGDWSSISTHDIEKIDVLKDASSAAIYGSRSANGVIIITTKKGNKGTPTINVSVNTGMCTPSFLRPIYSPQGYIDMRYNMYMQNNPRSDQPGYYNNPNQLPAGLSLDQWMGYSGSKGDAEEVWLQRLYFSPTEISNYKAGKTIDWKKELFQTGITQDYSVNISGGTDKINYYTSVNYIKNEGFVVGDEFSNFRARVNIDNKIADFLSVGINAQYSNRDESSIPVDWRQYSVLSPYGSIYEQDGETLKLFVHDDNGSTNPFLSGKYNERFNKLSNLSMKMYALVTLPFGFSYQFNYINIIDSGRDYNHTSSKNPSNATDGYASRANSDSYYWSVENMIKWTKTFGKHNFDVTLMANAEKNQLWDNQMENTQFLPSDVLGYHAISLGGNPIITSNDAVWTRNALLGRVNYTFNSKYLLTFSIRRDGYSAFGQNNPYALFPTSAIAWKISDESFYHLKPLNSLKLRLSYGANGNSAIGAYDALANMNINKYLLGDPSGNAYSVTALTMSKLSNAELKWEKTVAYNLGVDFGLFNDRIVGSLDAYYSKTTNLLIDRALPKITGFSSISSNIGQVDNKGLEINLTSNNMYIDKKFSWQTNFNAFFNRNKIVHLYGDKDDNGKEINDVANKWFIGHGLDEIWDYIPDGIWQNEDKDLAYSYGGYLPGERRMVDRNKDGQYTEVISGDWRAGDKDFIGFKKPRFQWNMVNNFTLLDQFTFSFSVYGSHGHKGNFLEQAGNERLSTFDIPYWTEGNRSNKWMRTQMLSSNSRPMSNYVSLGFVRVSDISLGYTIPNRITKLFMVENLSVMASVKNAFLLTKWPGWDPENITGPVPRCFNLSINIKL